MMVLKSESYVEHFDIFMNTEETTFEYVLKYIYELI